MNRLEIKPGSPLSAIRGNLADIETENIAELASRAKDKPDLIELWYGEGDIVTPDFIRKAAQESLDKGETFYVPQMAGRPDLSTALAAYQSDLHGVRLDTDRTTVTPGGMQSVHLALSLVLEAGDNAVYIEPQWPNIRHAIQIAGAEARPVSLALQDGAWTLDLDAVFDACDARTRAIVFSSPSNPCGWMADLDLYRQLLEFSRKTGIWIISDEVYSRLVRDGRSAPSLLQVAEPEDLALCINGFSKAWAMTGWRIGWLNHPASIAPVVRAMTQYINSGTASFIQAGALAAVTRGEGTVRMIRDRLSNGIDAAYDELSRSNAIILPQKPAGGMYAFFRIEGHDDANAACIDMVEKAHVGLAPGGMFGNAFKSWIRMCIARQEDKVRTACERLATTLQS